MDKYIGSMLGGRYQIEEIVGVGGMAVVYRARDTVLGRDVALKVLKKEFAEDPDIRKRFSIESRAVAKLSHHNIVSVFDVGSEDGTDYIVMELIEGITLKQYLQRKGHLSWEETIFFAEQVARALMHAHSRGIIHQDVKPQNVIILRRRHGRREQERDFDHRLCRRQVRAGVFLLRHDEVRRPDAEPSALR